MSRGWWRGCGRTRDAMTRTAVVLFNLGGPDRLEAVRPFLFNLFRDKAIIGLPLPLRLIVAWLIAKRRETVARDIYARMGGASPLLAETQAQARALEAALGPDHKAYIAMRYWHPLTDACAALVAAWKPDRVVLLPLYPQRSTTTTDSSFAAWRRAIARYRLDAPERAIESYPTMDGLVAAQAELIAPLLDEAGQGGAGPGVRLLLSAHGLPKRIVARGDDYPKQVEMTARAVVERLARPGLDWIVCYQSRVGPLEWIGPYTDDEIRRAGAERKALVVAPIAFVSEHSETLVELDMDYRRLAEGAGVTTYLRAPAVGTHPAFIAGLAQLVRATEQGS